jgi:hypothetical protein
VPQLLRGEKGDDLRSNRFKERGNDENQHAPLEDPLHVQLGLLLEQDPRRFDVELVCKWLHLI